MSLMPFNKDMTAKLWGIWKDKIIPPSHQNMTELNVSALSKRLSVCWCAEQKAAVTAKVNHKSHICLTELYPVNPA